MRNVVFTCVWFLVGRFVIRITQKLLNRFPRDLDLGWVSARKDPIDFWYGPRIFFCVVQWVFLNIVISFLGDNTWIWMKKISHINVEGIYEYSLI